jgi:hypothetical protein
VINEVRRGFGHAAIVAGGANAPPLAGEGDQKVVTAVISILHVSIMSPDATVPPDTRWFVLRPARLVNRQSRGKLGLDRGYW